MQQGPWQKYQAPSSQPPAYIPPPADSIRAQEREADARRQAEDQAIQRTQIDLSQQGNERSERGEARQVGNDRFSHGETLYTNFSTDQRVKDYTAAAPSFTAALDTTPTPQGDMSMVYAFAKMMDPTSVVRESEFDSAANTDTKAGQIIASYQKQMGEGGMLRPEVRQRLRAEMINRFQEITRGYETARQDAEYRAKQYGLDPAQVLPPHAGREFANEWRGYADDLRRKAPRPSADSVQLKIDSALDTDSPVPDGPPLTPQQEAAAQAFFATSPKDARQIEAFYQSIGAEAPTNADEIAGYYAEGGTGYGGTQFDPEKRRADLDKEIAQRGLEGDGTRRAFMNGLTFNLSDEIVGGAGGAVRALRTGEDFGDAYAHERDIERRRVERATEGSGGTAAYIAGSLFAPTAAARNVLAAPSLGARVASGAKHGAAAGALSGFGAGEGAGNSTENALLGAAAGTTIGAALPVAGGVLANRVQAGRRLIGKQPNVARDTVSRAIADDQNTPGGVARQITEAQSRGSPMSIADTGENVRGLLGSVSRRPGPARSIAKDFTVERQIAQAERISDAVRRDLGPTANIREMGDAFIERARADAGPLYDEAYAASGAGAIFPKIEPLLQRPNMARALKKAEALAREEGEDATALGFSFNEAGDVVLERVPSFKTLDYVKRGMDDVIEGYRDKTTGKLVLDGNGRAANNTLRAFLARVDKINPAYAKARKAYAGPAKLKDALEKGNKALRRSPDDLKAEIANMSPAEQEMYRMGLRKSITDMLDSRVDGGDKVQALLGTPKQRAALTKAFGGRAQFDRFIKTLEDEKAMGLTYKETATGSPTAERLAFDAKSGDDELFDAVVGGAANSQSAFQAVAKIIQRVKDAESFGAGKAGDEARESIATLLAETDPAAIREIARAARRAQLESRVKSTGRLKRAGRQGVQSGRVLGEIIAAPENSRP